MFNKSKENKTSHKGHMWMMAICCGLPIAGFLAIAVLAISMPSLETALFLLFPIGMIGMMYFMHRDGCARSEQGEDKKPTLSHDDASADPSGSSIKPENGNAANKPGWLEA